MMFMLEQHTADVRVRIEAATVEELFADAVRALMDVMGAERRREHVRREVIVESSDRTHLLIDFLNEILGLALIHGEAYDGVRFETISETHLHLVVEGERAGFTDEVKAVTYHEANVERRDDGTWTAALVLDI